MVYLFVVLASFAAALVLTPLARRLSFRLGLTESRDPETILRLMNEAGVLGRFIPEFGRIVALMQFNMYHHYTVDEHLIRCVGILQDIEAGTHEEFALANDLYTQLAKNTLYELVR